MWKILAQGALGLVILIDHTQAKPLRDLHLYLEHFQDLIRKTGCVVVISKMDASRPPALQEFAEMMQKNHMVCPVVAADVRDREQVLWVLDLLLVQMEARL
jgi:signal recognition particle receptor subunit beta